jgi:hypothetical protein
MEFITYKKYYEQERANAMKQILQENNIEFQAEEERENLDSLYGGSHFPKQFFIKIKGQDFQRADAVLKELSLKELANVAKDHYLFEFNDEELFEILAKPDEWNEFDVELARKILNDRGKTIHEDTLLLLRNQRLKELAKPEERQRSLVYAGYFFALLGGIIGAFIGWHLWTCEKVLPNGKRVYGFLDEDRTHGKIIFILGIVLFVFYVFIRYEDHFTFM